MTRHNVVDTITRYRIFAIGIGLALFPHLAFAQCLYCFWIGCGTPNTATIKPASPELMAIFDTIPLYTELKEEGVHLDIKEIVPPVMNGKSPKIVSWAGYTRVLRENEDQITIEVAINPSPSEWGITDKDTLRSTIFHELVHARQFRDLWRYQHRDSQHGSDLVIGDFMALFLGVNSDISPGMEMEAYVEENRFLSKQPSDSERLEYTGRYFLLYYSQALNERAFQDPTFSESAQLEALRYANSLKLEVCQQFSHLDGCIRATTDLGLR